MGYSEELPGVLWGDSPQDVIDDRLRDRFGFDWRKARDRQYTRDELNDLFLRAISDDALRADVVRVFREDTGRFPTGTEYAYHLAVGLHMAKNGGFPPGFGLCPGERDVGAPKQFLKVPMLENVDPRMNGVMGAIGARVNPDIVARFVAEVNVTGDDHGQVLEILLRTYIDRGHA
jgi:hypothetical protein